MRFAPVLYIFGLTLAILAASMTIPGLIDVLTGAPHADAFFVAAAVTLFCSVACVIAGHRRQITLSLRETYMLTTLCWVGIAFFGSLPLLFHGMGLSVTDAFFESISGLTTTGSTVLTGLDNMPKGVLAWRSMQQWLGGIGIIVTALIALPVLRVGGMQLYNTESSARGEKLYSSVAKTVQAIAAVYALLTILCGFAYYAAGMTSFDAAMHALTTLATGGYSTHDASMGHFTEPAVHWTAIVFMLAGALPFAMYIRVGRGRIRKVAENAQIRDLLIILAIVSTMVTVWITANGLYDLWDGIRHAIFNVVSVVTTTGYASADYNTWGGFAVFVFALLYYVGGCTGSTSGGIKIFRLQVIYIYARAQIYRQIMPHRVVPMTYRGRELPEDVGGSVLAFMGIYISAVILVGLLLAAMGLDFVSSFSSAAQAIGNVGPGLGPVVGPSGNFASLPDAAKWLLAAAMLLGRLELMTVLILLTPTFWRM